MSLKKNLLNPSRRNFHSKFRRKFSFETPGIPHPLTSGKTPLIGPVVVLALWSILSYSGLFDKLLLPFPHEVILNILEGFLVNRKFLIPLFQTAKLLSASFLAGGILGVALGMMAGYYDFIYNSFEVVLDFFRSLPSLLLLPLAVVFFGIGQMSSFMVISWASFVYVFLNTAYGVKYGKKSYLEVGRVLKISRPKRFFLIIFPSALPGIFSGLKMSFSVALIVTIGTEMLIGHQGIGGRVVDAYLIYNTKEVFSIVVIVGLLGYFMSKVIDNLEKKIIHWRGN
jgi:ABC-type nitrate/sulfonate/bicarbonate transport system permease component